MIKKLIFFAIIGGLVYLNYTNPKREDHEAVILAALQRSGPVSAEQFAAALKDVDFSNFMVCSATKTTLDNKVITFGYRKKVELKNDAWVRQTMQKLLGS
jgi:hypothetical protein